MLGQWDSGTAAWNGTVRGMLRWQPRPEGYCDLSKDWRAGRDV